MFKYWLNKIALLSGVLLSKGKRDEITSLGKVLAIKSWKTTTKPSFTSVSDFNVSGSSPPKSKVFSIALVDLSIPIN